MVSELDHIVVVAASIEAGLDHVERQIGVRLPQGGAHPLMGTHNHLVRLGDDAFLEVIAPDPNAKGPSRRRWFGLDNPPAVPRLAHWVVRVDDIDMAMSDLPATSGPAIPVTRGSLSWRLTVPDDGSLPEGGTFPTVLEWGSAPLPPRAMPAAGLALDRLVLSHPDPARLKGMIGPLIDDNRVEIAQGPVPSLSALIATPQGPKWLC